MYTKYKCGECPWRDNGCSIDLYEVWERPFYQEHFYDSPPWKGKPPECPQRRAFRVLRDAYRMQSDTRLLMKEIYSAYAELDMKSTVPGGRMQIKRLKARVKELENLIKEILSGIGPGFAPCKLVAGKWVADKTDVPYTCIIHSTTFDKAKKLLEDSCPTK